MTMPERPVSLDLTGDGLPGGNVDAGPQWLSADRPQPDDPAGDNSPGVSGWVKVGAGYQGGREFTYGDGYYAPDGPAPWKQT